MVRLFTRAHGDSRSMFVQQEHPLFELVFFKSVAARASAFEVLVSVSHTPDRIESVQGWTYSD